MDTGYDLRVFKDSGLQNAGDSLLALIEAAKVHIGEQNGKLAAATCATHCLEAMLQIVEILMPNFKQDDVNKVLTRYDGGGTKESINKLHTGFVKDIVYSFSTAIPLAKFYAADPVTKEYFLHFLLDQAKKLWKLIHMPSKANH